MGNHLPGPKSHEKWAMVKFYCNDGTISRWLLRGFNSWKKHVLFENPRDGIKTGSFSVSKGFVGMNLPELIIVNF
jgi:hypothetical protein